MPKFMGKAKVDKSARLEWPVHLRDVHVQSDVEIGRFTYIRQGSHVSSNTRIGRYCAIARNVEIAPLEHPVDWLSVHPFQYDNLFFGPSGLYDRHARRPRVQSGPTVLGNDVWIGAHVIVQRGVTIGDGAVIGANSFVNADVPPYAIVAGSPARVIRLRFAPEIVEQLLKLQWWELMPEQLDGVAFDDIETAIRQIAAIRDERAAQ